jgi:hypothetical protein
MQGGSTYIAWNTANADSCVANYAGKTESVATQQTQIVISPTQTTTYTLTCANGSYSAQKAVTVTVNPVTTTTGTTSGSTGTTGTTASTNTGAPTIGLSVAAASIVVGASTQIAWNTVNADSCLAYYNGRVEAVATQGLLTITPSTTTTYRLVCVNGATPAEKSVTVTVTPAVTALTTTGTNYPTFGLSAQSYRINAGDTTQIAWNTSDATTCTAYYNGVSENMALQGLISVSPATTTTYRLVCTNSTGSAERSITIVVTPR